MGSGSVNRRGPTITCVPSCDLPVPGSQVPYSPLLSASLPDFSLKVAMLHPDHPGGLKSKAVANPHLLASAGALVSRRLFLLGSWLNLLPQQIGHLLQAALLLLCLELVRGSYHSSHHPLQSRRPNAGHKVPMAQVRNTGTQTLESTGRAGNG